MADPNLTATPDSAMPGLDLFAAAWLERWLANGGSVHVDAEGQLSTQRQIYARDLPGYEPPPAKWADDQRRQRADMDDICLVVRQRELLALLEAVPGGRAAVHAHVRLWPSTMYADGSCEIA